MFQRTKLLWSCQALSNTLWSFANLECWHRPLKESRAHSWKSRAWGGILDPKIPRFWTALLKYPLQNSGGLDATTKQYKTHIGIDLMHFESWTPFISMISLGSSRIPIMNLINLANQYRNDFETQKQGAKSQSFLWTVAEGDLPRGPTHPDRADDSGGSVWRYTFIYKCIYLRLRDISGHRVLKIYMPRYNPILVWYIL